MLISGIIISTTHITPTVLLALSQLSANRLKDISSNKYIGYYHLAEQYVIYSVFTYFKHSTVRNSIYR